MPWPLALVGIGAIARSAHLPALAVSPDFTLAAAVSRNAALEGAPCFPDIAGLLASGPEVAAVSLCAPPQPRYAMAVEAIAAGRHVLLEKPPGATLAEVAALEAHAAAAGVVLAASWHSRHAAGVAAAKAWLADRRPRSIEIEWREDVRKWHPGQEWIWRAGGMGVFDPGVNALSIATEILPAALRVEAATLHVPTNCDTPVAAELALAGDGLQGRAVMDWRHEGAERWTLRVETDDGDVTLSEGGARIDGPGVGPLSPGTEYDGVYARFAAALRDGRCDVDVRPLRLVADAFMIGRRRVAPAFHP